MKSDIYWIAPVTQGRLAIMPRPRSGEWLEDEITGWQQAGIEMVVSLLTPAEVRALGLEKEAQYCADRALHFMSYPIPDRQIPTHLPTMLTLVRDIEAQLTAGKSVAIHCRAGIGRSALVAATVMVAQGMTAAAALAAITKARGVPVPDTEEQRQWVEGFGKQWKMANYKKGDRSTPR